MYRTLVILRLTFREAIVQPIYALLLGPAALVLWFFHYLPFFTLGEDAVMFKSVSLDIILLFVLLTTLFATSRSVFDEIEDRTMLTLMSKPVKKWEVLLGKYLGISLSALLAVAILGLVLIAGLYSRIPGDYQLGSNTLDDRVLKQIRDLRWMHIIGLLPSLLLVWMQISVLAAISVALSVRFSLVVNLPTVILFYFAGNLTRFLPLEAWGTESFFGAKNLFSQTLATLLPFLKAFDLRNLTVFSIIRMPGTEFANVTRYPTAVPLGVIFSNVAAAALYAVGYVTFALGSGLFMFQTRELGGAEG